MNKKTQKFYSNLEFIIGNISFLILLIFIFIGLYNYKDFNSLIISITITIIIYNLIILLFKSDLYKLSFDENGIKLWYLGKCEKEYKWNEIKEIGVYFRFDRLYLSTIPLAEYNKKIAYYLRKSQPYVTLPLSKKVVLEIIKYYDKEIKCDYQNWISIHRWLKKINEQQREKLRNKKNNEN